MQAPDATAQPSPPLPLSLSLFPSFFPSLFHSPIPFLIYSFYFCPASADSLSLWLRRPQLTLLLLLSAFWMSH